MKNEKSKLETELDKERPNLEAILEIDNIVYECMTAKPNSKLSF